MTSQGLFWTCFPNSVMNSFLRVILLQNSLVWFVLLLSMYTSVSTQTSSLILVLAASVALVSPKYQLKELQAETFILL